MGRENETFITAAEFQMLALFLKYPELELHKVDISDFPHKEAQAIYQAINILREKKETITEGSLLREANILCDKVDIYSIKTLFEYQVDLSNFYEAYKVLQEGSIKYKVQNILKILQEKVSSPDFLNPEEASALLYEAQDTIQKGSRKVLAKTLEQCLDEYEEELLARKEKKKYIFGDIFLDKMLVKGASPGQIILIAGSTGAGKSTYALNLINGMINLGIPCIYFSLEMDTISTLDRLLAMRTEIPVENWYASGNDINPLLKKVQEEKKNLENKPFRLVDDPEISISTIRNIIKEFKITYKVDYVCVYIDLITQIKDFIMLKKGGTLANTIEISVNQMNAIAKKENCCIVAIAQMNREADNIRITEIEDIDLLRPTINHVKNSHALGERARVVLSVFRPKYYAERFFPEHEELEYMQDILQIQILKQSQGVVGQIGKYLFDGPCFSIRPYIETSFTPVEESDISPNIRLTY